MILAPLQKLPKNVRDLGKLIVAKGLKKLSKVQKIANSGHTASGIRFYGNGQQRKLRRSSMGFELGND